MICGPIRNELESFEGQTSYGETGAKFMDLPFIPTIQKEHKLVDHLEVSSVNSNPG